jgi:hypothetical protein
MLKVSSLRKRDCCNDRCNDRSSVDPGSASINESRRIFRRGRDLFPINIRELLILLAEDEGDNDIDIVLKSSCPDHCFIKNADPIAVFDNTLVIRDSKGCEGKFTYIDICCICTVSFKCSVLLDELFESHNISGE